MKFKVVIFDLDGVICFMEQGIKVAIGSSSKS